MTGSPTAEAIPRRGRLITPVDHEVATEPADWTEVCATLRRGEAGPFWLSVGRDSAAPHVRPVFAAWTGSSFYFASKDTTAKTRHLVRTEHATVTVDLGCLHLVVEGRTARVTDPDGLRRASDAMRDVFDWPTEVAGAELEAGYGAPTSGGPPYQVFELVPLKAFGFPTRDQVAPTRWTWSEEAQPEVYR